jgi:co-chaperonin GroES (HSP10)
MKPLRNGVLIERKQLVSEEKRDSGIILLKSDFNLYQFDNDNQRATDIISKKKQNTGTVIAKGDDCFFVNIGDEVIYKKNSEQANAQSLFYEGRDCVLVAEENILSREINGLNEVHPNCIVVKITKESRESLFTKRIKKDNGEWIDLIVTIPPEDDAENHSQFFVTAGEVVCVGKNITTVQSGDIALCDYRVDNDESIIVGYEGYDKLIAVVSVTTRHTDDLVVHADRKTRRTQQVWCKGDYKDLSFLIGVLRGDRLIPIEPYVFLEHKDTVVDMKTPSGIEYKVDEKILHRKVLAVSTESQNNFGIEAGKTILIDDFDCFDIFVEGRKITAFNDVDIIAFKES